MLRVDVNGIVRVVVAVGVDRAASDRAHSGRREVSDRAMSGAACRLNERVRAAGGTASANDPLEQAVLGRR